MSNNVYSIQSYYINLAEAYRTDDHFWRTENVPELVTIKPTLKCVANCKHCESRLKDFDSEEQGQMSLDDYKKLFKDLARLGTRKLTISGGEPLTYRYLLELIQSASQEGLLVTLNTNGWLLNHKKFEEFLKAGLVGVNLSIDSPNAQIHDRLRSLPGLFEKSIHKMKEIRTDSSLPFILNIRMILSKHNYKDIPQMIGLCKELDADTLSIDMIENDHDNKLFLLNEDQIIEFNSIIKPQIIRALEDTIFETKELQSDAIQQISAMYDIDFNPISNFASGIYWPTDRIKNKCTIPSSFMIIEGNGQILPCNAVEYTRSPIVGNCITQSIDMVWTSQEWQQFREAKMEFCNQCPMNMSHMMKFKNQSIVPVLVPQ